jgi:hypothetical protein
MLHGKLCEIEILLSLRYGINPAVYRIDQIFSTLCNVALGSVFFRSILWLRWRMFSGLFSYGPRVVYTAFCARSNNTEDFPPHNK